MNKIFQVILTVTFVFGCLSCGDFLEENPVDRYTTDNFYSSEQDAEAATNAVYQQLYSIYRREMFLLNDLPADDHKNGLGMPNQHLQDLEFLRYTSENQFVRQMWQNNYSGISRANTAIENIPKITMREEMKNRFMAEAKFLRALFYFNLVRFYGDVPLVLKVESVQDAMGPRTDKEEVYNQIIEDLKFAEEHLSIVYPSESGRATVGAAKILMGKVYLTKRDYPKAVEKLAEVIENEAAYGYGLHDDYGDNWKVATENGKEMVFSIELMEAPGTSNGQMSLSGPKYSIHKGGGVPGITGANEADIPTEDLYNRFSEEDERKNATFKLDYFSPKENVVYTSTIPLFGKYWEEGEVITSRCDVNIHVIRYADALLMYAEALNEVGETPTALIHLNRVRARAFNNTDYNYAGLSQEEFRQAVLEERRLEFALEGHRWFDLVRSGRFVEVMKAHGIKEAEYAEGNKTEISANVAGHQMLYPIPQREIDLNKALTQNLGY
jgi:tetratricopeptide (TPR) repeat protein